jgi:hypothetical protein
MQLLGQQLDTIMATANVRVTAASDPRRSTDGTTAIDTTMSMTNPSDGQEETKVAWKDSTSLRHFHDGTVKAMLHHVSPMEAETIAPWSSVPQTVSNCCTRNHGSLSSSQFFQQQNGRTRRRQQHDRSNSIFRKYNCVLFVDHVITKTINCRD